MRAIILAAGKGSRLYPYTKDCPKGMLNVSGKSIIKRQIELFNHVGIKDIVIIRGYKKEAIEYDGVTYLENEEYDNTNMVFTFLKAREYFDQTLIVSYSDILYDVEILKRMIKCQGDAVVAVDKYWKKYWLLRYGRIDTDLESLRLSKDAAITDIGGVVTDVNDIDARYIGLLKFSLSGLNEINRIINNCYSLAGKSINNAYMTDLIQEIIHQNRVQVRACVMNNGWIEFDQKTDYELVQSLCDSKQLENKLNIKLF